MKVILCLLLLVSSSFGDEISEFSKKGNPLDLLKTDPKDYVPAYAGTSPQEISLGNNGNLDHATAAASQTDEAGQFISTTAQNRGYYVFDGKNDLFSRSAQGAIANPENTLKEGCAYHEEIEAYEDKECEEGKPAFETKCVEERETQAIATSNKTHVLTFTLTGLIKRGGCGLNLKNLKTGYQNGIYINVINPLPIEMLGREINFILNNSSTHPYIRHPARHSLEDGTFWVLKNEYRSVLDYLVKFDGNPVSLNVECRGLPQTSTNSKSGCSELKKYEKLGLCSIISTKVLETPKKTIFDGSPLQLGVSKIQLTYRCHYPAPNTCLSYRNQAYDQVDSQCIKKIGDQCVLWKQTFRVLKGLKQTILKGDAGIVPQATAHMSFPPNEDMMRAVAQLSVLQDVQRDIQGNTTSLPSIFKGSIDKCQVAFGGFSNCCSKGKGWGHSINLASCSGEEKALAAKVDKSLCVPVGEYCHKKVLGKCIKKKKSYCCFSSKLARLIHEQGRRQLGISFGDGKNPQCRGLTVEELSHLDFSRFELSELYEDIKKRFKNPPIDVVQRNLSHNVQTMLPSKQGKGEVY